MDEFDHKQSLSFLAMDDSEVPIGTCRIIFQGEHDLPIMKHFKLLPLDEIEMTLGPLTNHIEISRFVAPPNKLFKPHQITLALCQGFIKHCLNIGVSKGFMSIDYRFFRLLRMLKFPLFKVGESEDYMGSLTVPALLNLESMRNAFNDSSVTEPVMTRNEYEHV